MTMGISSEQDLLESAVFDANAGMRQGMAPGTQNAFRAVLRETLGTGAIGEPGAAAARPPESYETERGERSSVPDIMGNSFWNNPSGARSG